MSHACEILSFEPDDTQSKIAMICNDWGDANADYHERGRMCGLGFPIDWTKLVFNTYDEAYDYLEGTFGNYRQTAVKYRKAKAEFKETKAMEDLRRRIREYQERINELNKPHYKGVKSKTVKCKNCEAVLPTSYCGSSYHNNCPVCRADLRPESAIEKLNKYKDTQKKLEKDLKELRHKEEVKVTKKGYDLCWMVACEVHC